MAAMTSERTRQRDTGRVTLPQYPTVPSYTQSHSYHRDTMNDGTITGYEPFKTHYGDMTDTSGLPDYGATGDGCPSGKLLSGTFAPGQSGLTAEFTAGKYTPAEWHQNNYNKYYQSFSDRDHADQLRHQSKSLINATEAQTQRTQADVTKKIGQRMHDINYWKTELNREIEDMVSETDLLLAEKKRLESALDCTEVPLEIATDCLKNRERRQGIDLVQDNVEIELLREVELIKKVQDLLKRTIFESDKQIQCNRRAKHQLSKDWSDKFEALNIDNKCGRLTNNSTDIQLKECVDKISGGNSVPESWAQFTHDNIVLAENERMASMQLRGLINDILTDTANDMREQASTVEVALAKRVEQVHDAKTKLTNHLKKVCKEIADMEKNIKDLKQAIRDKEPPMAVSQTRLEARTHRPRVELCDDPVQKRLLEEVQEINESVASLQEKLRQAELSRDDLMNNRMSLEKEIAIKSNSLFIDREKCLKLRTRFPTITRLCGYQ